MLLMLAVVAFATIELGLMLFQRLVDPAQGMLLLEIDELLDLFGFFLLILIGIELLETIGMYLEAIRSTRRSCSSLPSLPLPASWSYST